MFGAQKVLYIEQIYANQREESFNNGENSMNREISYEQAISELEQIVEKLNSGCVALDEMVSLYENGVELADHCKELLSKYECRMDKAVRRNTEVSQDELF